MRSTTTERLRECGMFAGRSPVTAGTVFNFTVGDVATASMVREAVVASLLAARKRTGSDEPPAAETCRVDAPKTGPVNGGAEAAIVGERGPEMFVPFDPSAFRLVAAIAPRFLSPSELAALESDRLSLLAGVSALSLRVSAPKGTPASPCECSPIDQPSIDPKQ